MAKLIPEPKVPKHEALKKSYDILKYAHDTAESFVEAFDIVRKARNAKQGAPTDEEQDLLRAMVVFAGAGIDSMTKQLIRDALPVMVLTLPATRKTIEPLLARHLRRGSVESAWDDGDSSSAMNPRRLVGVLLADSPRAGLASLLIDDLTSGSLQSVEELLRAIAYFGLKPEHLLTDKATLQGIFECRNKIIHEMDIDFEQPNRNRFPRRKADMVKYATVLLRVSNSILTGVDEQLTGV